MSKLIATKVYQSYLPDGKIAISFIADDRYVANLFVRELEHLDKIEVQAKAHRESRTIRQNKMLWAIISKISDHINFEHTEESTMKIYGELLVKAQVKRDLIAILPDAIEMLKPMFRAVIPTGQQIDSVNAESGKKATLITVWVYHGSSRFNTKEMGELIDLALLESSKLGIVDSEIEMIRSEYGLWVVKMQEQKRLIYRPRYESKSMSVIDGV